ncbi:MAG: TonB-dependent receptor [Bacteroidetes bacterium]|nr:MAG: TonB-dependent receptor [Bacteroidota bacterium]
MLHKAGFILLLVLAGLTQAAFAQDGKLSGKVLDADNQPVAYASVRVYSGDQPKFGGQTDENGVFSINPVTPGTYRVEARYLQATQSLDNVSVLASQTRNIVIKFAGDLTKTLDVVEIYDQAPFEKSPIVGTTLTNENIVNSGIRNVQTLASLTAGVFQGDEGGSLYIRGARDNATTYIIDGVKIRGQSTVPQASIGQFQVITGGTPAEFGDFTGGVINITTSNPSSEFSGNVELQTSQYLDPYGKNLAGLSLSGPIIKRTRYIEGTEKAYKTSVLGFFINAEADYDYDSDPVGRGIYQLKPGLLADLQQTPLQAADDGLSFRSRANYIRETDFEQVSAKTNNNSLRLRGLARLDFQPADNVLVKVGGSYEHIDLDQWGLGNSLFAPDPQGQFLGKNYRAWARFQQSFQGGKNSAVRNLFYTLQADYSGYERNFINSVHRDNVFDYGYVGKFDYDITPVYTYVDDPNDPFSSSPYWRTAGYAETNLQFDPTNSRNPLYANYNTTIIDYAAQNGLVNLGFDPFNTSPRINYLTNITDLGFRQGIANGGGPRGIYSLFSGIGANSGTYQKFQFEQFRITGQATAEIKGHNLKAGFEFEQRVERAYSLAPRGLWSLMRQYANFHLQTLNSDPSSWTYGLNGAGEWNDTVSVPLLYSAASQKEFDKNVREKLGLPVDGTDVINIDALGPEFFSLDMFTADELLNQGLGVVTYYGYDYKGNKTDRVAPERFFTDILNRPENAFSPTYISAFLQDQFEFEDIIFNVGVRVDRFDANQKVLKDQYSLYPTYTAAELASGNLGIPAFTLPEGVGADYVPYVNSASSFSEILGYRSGETWYDRSGSPISSAELARLSGGKVQPAVKIDSVGPESFRDYTPQTVVMPRVSFSFPISDMALFFAHYDVLAQRPGQLQATQGSLLAGQISDYAFLENRPTSTVVNPNLKPEITVDYEAGFKQRVGARIGLTMSAFYRRQRNMINFRRFANAFPFAYDSYDNLDFGNVKGFSFSFDMQRIRNFQLRTSYTLQYSDATGSDQNSARNVTNFLEGFGVLRTTLPTNFDQRHRLVGNFDYRFMGRSMGPALNIGERTFYPLREFGANLTATLGSGTPYTKNAVPIASVLGGVNLVNQIQGTPNGARLPWQFRLDFRLDKSFVWGGKPVENEPGKTSRAFDANIYIQFLNVLNTQNIVGVYRYTGLPDDDGFLSSASGSQYVLTQIDSQSFVDLYQARVNNPDNYSLPRRIRLGLLFNF